MCILNECNIQYPEEIVILCDIPYEEALKRIEKYETLKSKDKFYTSKLEIKVKQQLQNATSQYKNDRKNGE